VHTQFLFEGLMDRDHFGDVGLEGMNTVKLILMNTEKLILEKLFVN